MSRKTSCRGWGGSEEPRQVVLAPRACDGVEDLVEVEVSEEGRLRSILDLRASIYGVKKDAEGSGFARHA